jgi:signal transduction histidine kinase
MASARVHVVEDMPRTRRRDAPSRLPRRQTWTGAVSYLAAAALVLVAAAGTMAIRGVMGTSASILFFPAVLFSAIYGGYGPSLFATLFSTVILGVMVVRPADSFAVGADDVVRLGAFAVVAMVTTSISSARKRAEDAQRAALRESHAALETLQKVSGWPVFVDVSIAGAASKLLAHAASVVQCTRAIALWEAEDEPWIYLATSAGASGGVVKLAPAERPPVVPEGLEDATFISTGDAGAIVDVMVSRGSAVSQWRGQPIAPAIAAWLDGAGVASAPFEVERLKGRMFFSGLSQATIDLVPLLDVVAHEVGNSLERLHLHDRLQQLARHEERIRVARDLHDGVLQSLTAIRLRLQGLADSVDAPSSVRDSLVGVERAIAAEQRELRLFIEDLKPAARREGASGVVATALEQLRGRLALEWTTPITIRVMPEDLAVSAALEPTIRLLIREAVVNAMKHARPTRVSVDVAALPDSRLRIVVADDGGGFPFQGRVEHDECVASQAGPVSLQERLISVGGSLAIESTAGGSRIEMTVPLAPGGEPRA